MDPEDINIFLYYSLLQADPPDDKVIPDSSLVPDISSASSSTLTFERNFNEFFRKENYYKVHERKRIKLEHPMEYEFDLTVLYKDKGLYKHRNESDSTVSTIVTNDLHNTADYPIATTYRERQYNKVHRLDQPFGFIIRIPSTLHRTNYYRQGVSCKHQSLNYYYREGIHENEEDTFIYGRALRYYLSKGCYRKHMVDKPTKDFLRRIISYSTSDQYKEGYNCYTVVPLDTSSLLVNQFIKRVQFSDITIYRSSYYNTRADPTRLPSIRDNKYQIILQRQGFQFYYQSAVRFSDKYIWKGIKKGTRFQDPFNFVECTGRDSDGHPFYYYRKTGLITAPNPDYIFKSDQKYIRALRFFKVKPSIVKDPVHPFCVAHDYPALYRIFWKNQVKYNEKACTGIFKPDPKKWISKDPNRLSDKDRQFRRNWIYRELQRTWSQAPVN